MEMIYISFCIGVDSSDVFALHETITNQTVCKLKWMSPRSVGRLVLTKAVLILYCICICVTHLHETSRMSAEFVFRYGPKCMGGVILPILVLLHL